jgi:hypothetical protein
LLVLVVEVVELHVTRVWVLVLELEEFSLLQLLLPSTLLTQYL